MVNITASEVKNAFLVLGLPMNATKEQFKIKYREMVKAVHTDIRPELGEEQWRKLNHAKTVLLAFYLEKESNNSFLTDEMDNAQSQEAEYGQWVNGKFRPFSYADYGAPVMPQPGQVVKGQKQNPIDPKLIEAKRKLTVYINQVFYDLIDELNKINFNGNYQSFNNLINNIKQNQETFLNNVSTSTNLKQIDNQWLQVYNYIDQICISYGLRVLTQSEEWARYISEITIKYQQMLRQFYEEFDLFTIDFFFENDLSSDYILDKEKIYNQLVLSVNYELGRVKSMYKMVDVKQYDINGEFNEIIKLIKQQLIRERKPLSN